MNDVDGYPRPLDVGGNQCSPDRPETMASRIDVQLTTLSTRVNDLLVTSHAVARQVVGLVENPKTPSAPSEENDHAIEPLLLSISGRLRKIESVTREMNEVLTHMQKETACHE